MFKHEPFSLGVGGRKWYLDRCIRLLLALIFCNLQYIYICVSTFSPRPSFLLQDCAQSYTIKMNPIKLGPAVSPTASSTGLGNWNPEGSIISSTSGASNEEEDTDFGLQRNKQPGNARKGYLRSFTIGLQRVLLFTDDSVVNERIKEEASYSLPILEASLSLKAVGLSLVDDTLKRELAYVALME